MSGALLSLRTEELAGWLPRLVAGERLTLSGVVYAAGAEAADWLLKQREEGQALPFSGRDRVLCAGLPAFDPRRERADLWEFSNWEDLEQCVPPLFSEGSGAFIGRGSPSPAVMEVLSERRSVCFAPVGGSAVLNAKAICSVGAVRGEGLREGALLRVGILELPLVVTVDAVGSCLYQRGPEKYRRKPNIVRW